MCIEQSHVNVTLKQSSYTNNLNRLLYGRIYWLGIMIAERFRSNLHPHFQIYSNDFLQTNLTINMVLVLFLSRNAYNLSITVPKVCIDIGDST
jgi:hypothetical protein